MYYEVITMAGKQLPGSFNELLRKADRPILVDFWAEWCGPCRALGPVVQDIARSYKGRLYVVKVNIDEKPGLARQYNISSIPALKLFHDGKIIWEGLGAMNYHSLATALDQKLAAVAS